MQSNIGEKKIKEILEKLPGIKVVNDIKIKDKIIEEIVVEKESLGRLTICRLQTEDAPALFDFYFNGLSKEAKVFDPYPLFQPPVASVEELSTRIEDWKKEDDWTVLKFVKDKEIIGIGILKKYKKEKPVNGLAVRGKFQGIGVGTLIQTIMNEQAHLLGLEKLWSGTNQGNIASLLVHARCGFRLTGVLAPHFAYKNGTKIIDRYDIEMVKDLDAKNGPIFKSLGIDDFANSFGSNKEEISLFCGDVIKSADFKYRVSSQEEREKIFLDVIKKCDKKVFSVSGAHRKPDWRKGWGEILDEFNKSNQDLSTLVPKDIHGDRPLRYNGDYIIPNSSSFEHNFFLVFRNWLFKKYFKDHENIYEFGCGTGHNLVLLAKIFPDKKFFGMDWAPESQQILNSISERYGLAIEGHCFDFFKPDYNLQLASNSLVYTSSALEQLGKNYDKFIDYLLAEKPSLCVNVECIDEYYNENSLFDYLALKYHKTRNYLEGFLSYLKKLEKDKKIEIIITKRVGFGSLYHEGFPYVIWRPT